MPRCLLLLYSDIIIDTGSHVHISVTEKLLSFSNPKRTEALYQDPVAKTKQKPGHTTYTFLYPPSAPYLSYEGSQSLHILMHNKEGH